MSEPVDAIVLALLRRFLREEAYIDIEEPGGRGRLVIDGGMWGATDEELDALERWLA